MELRQERRIYVRHTLSWELGEWRVMGDDFEDAFAAELELLRGESAGKE